MHKIASEANEVRDRVQTPHKEPVCSITPCSYGDSWRFMIIHALGNNDVEHQSHLNAFFFFFYLSLFVFMLKKKKNPLGTQETAACT